MMRLNWYAPNKHINHMLPLVRRKQLHLRVAVYSVSSLTFPPGFQ